MVKLVVLFLFFRYSSPLQEALRGARFFTKWPEKKLSPSLVNTPTRLSILIRDETDRPEWHRDDVTFFQNSVDDRTFDFTFINDKEYFSQFKLRSGSFEQMKEFAQHKESGHSEIIEKARYAIIYVNNPLTKAVDILDTPGFGHNEIDDETATYTSCMPDISVFCSSTQGFMDEAEIVRLQAVIKNTNRSMLDDDPAKLSNIYLLMTMAHQAGGRSGNNIEDSVKEIARKASLRIHKPLKEQYQGIEAKDIEERVFSFSTDQEDLSTCFNESLHQQLATLYPSIAKEQFRVAIESRVVSMLAFIEDFKNTLSNLEIAKKALENLRGATPDRNKKFAKLKSNIKETIKFSKAETVKYVRSDIKVFAEQTNLEKIIKDNFDSSKEAKKALPGLVSSILEKRISDALTPHSERIKAEVDDYLVEFQASVSFDRIQTDSNFEFSGFDATAAMMGGISGLGSVGALALWASVVASGSNLGGYIAVAKIAAFLNSIGIGISSGVLITIISSTGGLSLGR